jgi:hypothetical protein
MPRVVVWESCCGNFGTRSLTVSPIAKEIKDYKPERAADAGTKTKQKTTANDSKSKKPTVVATSFSSE